MPSGAASSSSDGSSPESCQPGSAILYYLSVLPKKGKMIAFLKI
jgi:hypothetical protein